jgi:hypothetical protein
VSAIPAPFLFVEPRTPVASSAPVHDVTDSIKSWGRAGIILGANFGLVLGAILVAIPFTTDVLTFGVVGTLLVGAVECAVIAGGFAALGAALFANGVRGRSTARFERILVAGRRSAVAVPRDVPLAEWPARWAYPVQTSEPPLLPAPDEALNMAYSLPEVQARLSTIDAWENGNTGP